MTVVDLHYIDSGVDNGAEAARLAQPPLLLIHGIGASSRDWEYVLPKLSQARRVIAPDLRGYGQSPCGSNYAVPTLAADVWALLDNLGVERFDLVGHSMGGAVALKMAVDRPERIERAVFADTLPSFATDTAAKQLMYWSRTVLMLLLGPLSLTRRLALRTFPGEDQVGLRTRIIDHGGGSRSRFVYLRTLHALRGWRVENRLSRIRMPALVLAAEHDYFPRADAEAFAAALPCAELEIVADAHHHLPLEVPDIFVSHLHEFFEGHPAADIAA